MKDSWRLQWQEWVILLACFCKFSTYSKAIWLDEAFGFAFAGFSSLGDAVKVAHWSIAEINHGQTGIYFLLNQILLNVFSPSYFWFRFPSLFSAVLSIALMLSIMRMNGIALCIRLFFAAWMAYSPLNFSMATEARPYMLWQCSVLAFIWVLQKQNKVPPKQQTIWGLVLAVLFGSLCHPFFIIYASIAAFLMYVFFIPFRSYVSSKIKERRGWYAVLLCASFYLLVGFFSWFQNIGRTHNFDPFMWIGRERSLLRVIWGNIFAPYGKVWALVILISGIVLCWRFFEKKIESNRMRNFLFFTILGLLTQAIVLYLPYRTGYWILPRQWILSIPLACLSCAFLLDWQWVKRIDCYVSSVFLLLAASFYFYESYVQLQRQDFKPTLSRAEYLLKLEEASSDSDFSTMANYSVYYDQSVDRRFARLYRMYFSRLGRSY